MTHLHLARDVQVVAGIRLRQVPAIFRQRCERRNCKQKQCQQSAFYKRREPFSQMEARFDPHLLIPGHAAPKRVIRFYGCYRLKSSKRDDEEAGSFTGKGPGGCIAGILPEDIKTRQPQTQLPDETRCA
jgi:hypothetical protein